MGLASILGHVSVRPSSAIVLDIETKNRKRSTLDVRIMVLLGFIAFKRGKYPAKTPNLMMLRFLCTLPSQKYTFPVFMLSSK